MFWQELQTAQKDASIYLTVLLWLSLKCTRYFYCTLKLFFFFFLVPFIAKKEKKIRNINKVGKQKSIWQIIFS